MENQDNISQISQHLLDWFRVEARDLPWRHSSDPYGIWISEIMLQQTQVVKVIDFWNRWMQRFPDVRSVAEAPVEELLNHWQGLGYYRRCRNIHNAARIIIEKHDGRFPDSHDAILTLPGIGKYTAGAIASIAFNQPTPIVDGNVERVLSRVFLLKGDIKSRHNQIKAWDLSQKLVESTSHQVIHHGSRTHGDFNQSLMELGAMVCTPTNPNCLLCPIRSHCRAFQINSQESLPEKAPKKVYRQLALTAWGIHCPATQQILIKQAGDNEWNAGLWGFPTQNHEGSQFPPVPDNVSDLVAPTITLSKPSINLVGTVKHTITHNRLEIQIITASPSKPIPPTPISSPFRWIQIPEIHQLPFSALSRKIIQLLSTSGWEAFDKLNDS